MTKAQSESTSCCGQSDLSYIDALGNVVYFHELEPKPIEKFQLLKFLRDTKRICWLEIYLKLASLI